jgi:hypothetical protein
MLPVIFLRADGDAASAASVSHLHLS